MVELSDREWVHVERIDNRCAEERNLITDSLCASCKHGQVMRRKGRLDVTVWCRNGYEGSRDVPADLAECSEYDAKGAPSLRDMERLAHPIDPRDGINDKAYL